MEQVEYEQTQDLVNHSTPDTPQSHQCRLAAQSVQQTDQLKHVLFGGEIGEDGKETIRSLSYNAIFAYVVKSHSRVEPTSEGSAFANRRAKARAQSHL